MPGRVRSCCPDDKDVLQHFGELPCCPSLCQAYKNPVKVAAGIFLCGDTEKEVPHMRLLATEKAGYFFLGGTLTHCKTTKQIKT